MAFLGEDPNQTRAWKQLMNGVSSSSHPEEKSQPSQQHHREVKPGNFHTNEINKDNF